MQGAAGPAAQPDDAAATHAAWLARQYGAFEQHLTALLAGPDAVLQVAVACCELWVCMQGCACASLGSICAAWLLQAPELGTRRIGRTYASFVCSPDQGRFVVSSR